ncbi:MAG: SDR family NAD(P)-dependent oxidoreductase, partial [Bradyrhizobium sp.]
MRELMSLDGRVALVTGGAGHIGRAIGHALAELGASVAVVDLSQSGAAAAAIELEQRWPAKAAGFACDLEQSDQVRDLPRLVRERFGRIDIVVNNAGIGIDRPIEAIDAAAFDRMINIHVKGTFFCARAAVPAMKAQRWGRIVNVSSRWAQAGHVLASDYIAAKGAVLGLTKAWAKELAPFGITVNAIAPGGVWSRMVLETLGEEGVRREEREVPLGRWAQPDEIASSIAFLVSDE